MKGPTEQRAEFTEQIEKRFDEALREFQDLELRQMRKGEMKARAKLAQVKKGFDAKRDALRSRLDEATKASSAAWSDAKTGLESAWEELRAAVDEARNEFSDAEKAEEKETQSA